MEPMDGSKIQGFRVGIKGFRVYGFRCSALLKALPSRSVWPCMLLKVVHAASAILDLKQSACNHLSRSTCCIVRPCCACEERELLRQHAVILNS